MNDRWPRSEVELGRAVCAYLSAERWELFSEVDMHGVRFDIVARRGPVLMAVELKRNLGFSVVGQAMRARAYAHCVAVGVPTVSWNHSGRFAAAAFLRSEGIGLIEAGNPNDCDMVVPPRILRRPPLIDKLKAALSDPIQSNIEPGSNRGGYATAFSRTCLRFVEFVKENPGCLLREAVAGIEHHYAHDKSARGVLSQMARGGSLKGIEVKYEGRSPRLYPVEPAI